MALHRRLLQDIADLQNDPYPNIALCVGDSLEVACLILTPSGKKPLHLTVLFGKDYPLVAPQVTIESFVEHPNVFGSYICASILNTSDGYTPAYTLKGIAIQLLSFFSSDRIEQSYGGSSVELTNYRRTDPYSTRQAKKAHRHLCTRCGFGKKDVPRKILLATGLDMFSDSPIDHGSAASSNIEPRRNTNAQHDHKIDTYQRHTHNGGRPSLIERVLSLPDEILLQILGDLDTKDLLTAAKVCNGIAQFVNSYDTIRMRELQCFCFKKNFMQTKLGVGVHVIRRGKQGTFESEFDLLSQEAFKQHHVRRSIHSLPFEHWLPLPLSRRHWRSVAADTSTSLALLAKDAKIQCNKKVNFQVIYRLMNSIVVKLSREAEQYWRSSTSTLTHASEKAIEAYFSMFHLLLCEATQYDVVVQDANRQVRSFGNGKTSKEACPDLGELLVAVLVSDRGLTQDLTLAIVKEAILRNVVWMLDPKGADMAQLSYIEPSATSDYRLQQTFEASKTSYRLLMFLSLFYRTAREPGKPIRAICDDLFDRHGAPPQGTAEKMAAEIRNIRTVSSFSEFFKVIGLVETPSKEDFCAFLKRSIDDSVRMGYSIRAITQEEALKIRKIHEPRVEVAEGVVPAEHVVSRSFFPQQHKRQRSYYY